MGQRRGCVKLPWKVSAYGLGEGCLQNVSFASCVEKTLSGEKDTIRKITYKVVTRVQVRDNARGSREQQRPWMQNWQTLLLTGKTETNQAVS